MATPNSTRILILSDTHSSWPYNSAHPAPRADIFLHCGDLTQVGGLASFKRAIADIKSIDAPLKLVIAGNHDLGLDEKWVRENDESEEESLEESLEESRECVNYMKAQKEFGIHYLKEGVHEFELQDGKRVRVYASPYTPAFNGYTLAYGKDEDRFNKGDNAIPEGIDIVMTHGPPLFPSNENYGLDANQEGKHCGCEKLASAMRRVKPRLHCFGHIHEGRGTARMAWESGEMSDGGEVNGVLPDVLQIGGDKSGGETLFLNAAVHNGAGCLVDIEL